MLWHISFNTSTHRFGFQLSSQPDERVKSSTPVDPLSKLTNHMHNKLASLFQPQSSVPAGYLISASTAYDPAVAFVDLIGVASHQHHIAGMNIRFVKRSGARIWKCHATHIIFTDKSPRAQSRSETALSNSNSDFKQVILIYILANFITFFISNLMFFFSTLHNIQYFELIKSLQPDQIPEALFTLFSSIGRFRALLNIAPVLTSLQVRLQPWYAVDKQNVIRFLRVSSNIFLFCVYSLQMNDRVEIYRAISKCTHQALLSADRCNQAPAIPGVQETIVRLWICDHVSGQFAPVCKIPVMCSRKIPLICSIIDRLCIFVIFSSRLSLLSHLERF